MNNEVRAINSAAASMAKRLGVVFRPNAQKTSVYIAYISCQDAKR